MKHDSKGETVLNILCTIHVVNEFDNCKKTGITRESYLRLNDLSVRKISISADEM